MNKVAKCIIPILLVIFLIQPAFGYGGMGDTTSTADDGESTQHDLENTTDSDQYITLPTHLVEVDLITLKSENKIFIRETLYFSNVGTENYLGSLRSWLPDGVEGKDVKVFRSEMMTNGNVMPLQKTINGNIVSWNDFIKAKDPLSPLYILEYSIPAEQTGMIKKSMGFNKKFFYPTLLTKQPLIVILKVINGEDDSISVKDENGNSISASGNPSVEGDNSVLYRWERAQFKEFNVEISKYAFTTAQVASYAIPGIVILLILLYPFLRKKSGTLQNIENKITEKLKHEAESDEYEPEEVVETASEPVVIDSGLSGKSKDELENEKREIQSKISTLETEYASGDLLDEEYEELRSKYLQKADNIDRQLKEVGGSVSETAISEPEPEDINAKLEKLYKDHAVGKISYKEFKELRNKYQQEGTSDETAVSEDKPSSGEPEDINAKLEKLYKDHAVGKISYKEFKELKKSYEEQL